MSIIIKSGSEVVSLLRDISFKNKWDDLFKNCRWVTPYQSYNYISSWYEAYSQQYTPLLVFQLSQQDKLVGLLPLAIHKHNGTFEIAGAHQTEYQAWLADTSCEDTFIQESLRTIFTKFNVKKLTFKYVLGRTPLRWLHSKTWSNHSVLKSKKRPLINLEGDKFSLKLIKNKTNRNRLNRLKRQGEVKYAQIKDRDLFLKTLPKFEAIYDFRMLATYGVAPFSSDRSKRAFYLAMFDKKNLLHISVLHVGNQIVAFKIAIKDEKILYGSVTSFSPLFARLGPAKLHLFYLFQDLIENNFSFYDLTPGHDPWKDSIANTYETVFEITFFNSSFRRNLARFQFFLKEHILHILIKLGVKPNYLWIIARSFGHNLVKGIAFDTLKIIFPERNSRYRVNVEQAKQLPEYNRLSKDNLEDFLKIYPRIPGGLFNNFLVNSQKNFHAGQHPYTATTSNSSFLFCGWLTDALNPQHISTTISDNLHPKKVVLIRDITAAGKDMSVDFIELALTQMIRDAALIPEVEEIIVIVPKKNNNLLESIDKLNQRHSGLLEIMTG